MGKDKRVWKGVKEITAKFKAGLQLGYGRINVRYGRKKLKLKSRRSNPTLPKLFLGHPTPSF